jgi:hypothetical protein
MSDSSINFDGVPKSPDWAHQVTWKLKAPLNYCFKKGISIIFPLEGTVCHQVGDVVKRAFTCLLVIFLFIPACVLYGLGTISGRIAKTPIINPEGLHLKPPPTPLLNEELNCDLNLLKNMFAEELPGHTNTESFNRMIDLIEKRCPWLLETYKGIPPSFYDDMTALLRNIIDLLEKNKEKKRDVLNALAEAAAVCPPTWYEVAKKQYNLLAGKNDAESLLLNWIQDIKEEIILHEVQINFGGAWHLLNHVRFQVGEELGLNSEQLKNDPYFSTQQSGLFSKNVILTLFKLHYQTDNLITAIQAKINEDPRNNFYQCFFDMLNTAMKAHNGDAGCFYDEDDFTITRNGVIMLLKIIGILD